MSSSKVGQTSTQPDASTSATQIEGPEPEEHANWQPKLAFANERTFLAWAHFTVLLGAIAVGMLNFHPKNELTSDGDSSGPIAATVLSFLAILIMLYALASHNRRASTIRHGDTPESVYIDRFGPTFVIISFIAAFILNIVLRRKQFGSGTEIQV
ncbi:GTPase regulator Nrf1 [Stygiomarasmius scandens]|uniref:GTPase regulator Nrf1 n=1 Tax=Marasmiellus scandens TaxID=2682957 RepID=A0ABR1JMS3_9AGAR